MCLFSASLLLHALRLPIYNTHATSSVGEIFNIFRICVLYYIAPPLMLSACVEKNGNLDDEYHHFYRLYN